MDLILRNNVGYHFERILRYCGKKECEGQAGNTVMVVL